MPIPMPPEQDLPAGALRDLVRALHDLYRDAGKPSTRQISLGVRPRKDFPDTVSHEAVGSMLRGSALIRWMKLESIVRLLVEKRVTGDTDVDRVVRQFHGLWLLASDELDRPGGRPGGRLGSGPAPRDSDPPGPPPPPEPPPVPEGPPVAEDPPVLDPPGPWHPPVADRSPDPGPAPGPDQGRLINLQRRDESFTGRSALLRDLDRAVRESRGRPVLLVGHGGLGKTQVALEYAHRQAASYDLVWWLAAEQPESLVAGLGALAGSLGMPAFRDAARTAAAVVDRLESGRERWLLVFDNANDAATLQRHLPSGGDILVTTRNPALGDLGVTLAVPVFSREDSIAYLCRRDRRLTRPDADRVAERLGDLPLALAQVWVLHTTTGMSLPRYLDLFAGHLEELLAEGRPEHYETTLTALVQLAVDRLESDVPVAARLLAVLAHLGPEPVPFTLLRAGARGPLTPALARALADRDRLKRLATDLAAHGLVTFHLEADRVSMHRLIRDCVRQCLRAEAFDRGRADAHAVLVAADPGNPDSAGSWPLYGLIAPHVTPSELIEGTSDEARRLVVRYVRYLHQTGDYEASRRLAEAARDRWASRPGAAGGMEWPLEMSRHLANALRARASYRAAGEITRDALMALRESPSHGPDHELTLRLAFSAGYDLRLAGEYAAARALDDDTLERCLRVYGAGHRHALTAQNNLAVSLRLLGAVADAERLDLAVHAGWSTLRGEHDLLAQRSVMNLAWDQYGLGRYGEMSRQAAQAWGVLAERLPPTHDQPLVIRRAQVVALQAGGFWRQAVTLSESVYDDHVRSLGPDHERTLGMGLTRVNALRSVGRQDAARDLAVETQQAYQRQFGARHPGTAAASVALAAVLRSGRRLEEARRIDEEAYRDLSAGLGPAHPFVVCAVNGLAGDLVLQGLAAAAARLLEGTVDAFAEAMGPEHPVVLACRANLAGAYRLGGDPDRAERLGALAALRRVLGDGHPHTERAERGEWVELNVEPPPA